MMNIGIDFGKRRVQVRVNDYQGTLLDELSLSNDSFGAI
jgi:hypothetical protein